MHLTSALCCQLAVVSLPMALSDPAYAQLRPADSGESIPPAGPGELFAVAADGSSVPGAVADAHTVTLRSGAAVAAAVSATADLESLARQDPLALLELARWRCLRDVQDYSCTFTKQERIRGQLLAEASYQVKFRQDPQSVLMVADRPISAKRVLFVRGAHVDRRGRPLMLVEPAGWQRLLVSSAKVPLDDPRVLATSQRTIDQFGFLATLENMVDVCRDAQAENTLDLQYSGPGSIDGRPTFSFIRHLPYSGPSGRYPNGRLVLHLDREWLLPVSVGAFADRQEREVLARYTYSNVELNQGLGDETFKF